MSSEIDEREKIGAVFGQSPVEEATENEIYVDPSSYMPQIKNMGESFDYAEKNANFSSNSATNTRRRKRLVRQLQRSSVV